MKSGSFVRLVKATVTAKNTCGLHYSKRQFALHERAQTCSSAGSRQVPNLNQFAQQRESRKADEGAAHLISFDTSPLVGHTQQTLSLLRLLA